MAALWAIVIELMLIMIAHSSANKVSSDQVEKLGSRYLDFRFRQNPDYAAVYGIKKYRNVSEQWNFNAFNQRVEESRSMLSEVNKMFSESLEKSDKLTLLILSDNLQTVIDGFKFINYTVVLNGDIGDFPRKLERFAVEDVNDLQDWYLRCQSYIQMLKDQYELLTAPEYQNLYPVTSHTVNWVVKGLNKTIKESVDDFFSFKPWKDLNIQITNTSFYNEGLAMSREFNEILTNITNYLREVYLPTRARTRIGVSTLLGGSEMYEACLRFHTTPEYTAEKAHQLGLSEVKRIHSLMDAIVKRDRADLTVRQYVEHLLSQPNQTFSTPNEMAEGYRDMIKNQINPKLSTQFNYKPTIELIVEPDPGSNNFGSYSSPSLDGKTPGKFVFDNADPTSTLKGNMLSIAVHEGNPGHHYQISYSIETGLPLFRRLVTSSKYEQVPFNFPFYTAYSEGWALYAESLAPELNISVTDNQNFGRLGLESLRAARLVVDTGIHYYNWTYERAVEYLVNHTTLSEQECEFQISRYIRWPGQACAYKVGEIEIRKMKAQAEKELGDKYDVKLFHNKILSMGRASIPVVRNEIMDWIKTQKEKTNNAEGITPNIFFSFIISLFYNIMLKY